MTEYFKRDPAGVPQEIQNLMAKRLLGDKTDGHAAAWNLSQLGADLGSTPAGGSGDTGGEVPVLDANELLEAVKMAYRKHHLGDDTIGWDELSEKLLDTLCNAMGASGFLEWMKNATSGDRLP